MTPAPGPRAPQILVADDDDHFRRMVGRLLARKGYRVLEARDPAEFWALVGGMRHLDNEVDLILTDIRMPLASGVDVAMTLRRCRWRCPILFMTGYALEADERAVRELGSALLRKPFRAQDLFGHLQRLVSGAVAVPSTTGPNPAA